MITEEEKKKWVKENIGIIHMDNMPLVDELINSNGEDETNTRNNIEKAFNNAYRNIVGVHLAFIGYVIKNDIRTNTWMPSVHVQNKESFLANLRAVIDDIENGKQDTGFLIYKLYVSGIDIKIKKIVNEENYWHYFFNYNIITNKNTNKKDEFYQDTIFFNNNIEKNLDTALQYLENYAQKHEFANFIHIVQELFERKEITYDDINIIQQYYMYKRTGIPLTFTSPIYVPTFYTAFFNIEDALQPLFYNKLQPLFNNEILKNDDVLDHICDIVSYNIIWYSKDAVRITPSTRKMEFYLRYNELTYPFRI